MNNPSPAPAFRRILPQLHLLLLPSALVRLTRRLPVALRPLLLVASTTHCGGGLTLVPQAEPPTAEPVSVTSLPPPALPEEIPPLTSEQGHLAWMDGCWEWSVGRWIWARGGWVEVPQRGAYFPGKIAVAPHGGLLWLPCSWVVDGKPIGLITPDVPARYPASARSVAR